MRKMVLFAAAFSLAAPLAFLAPGTASATTCSPTQTGKQCDGQSPTGTGCSVGAYTAEQVTAYDSGYEIGWVQLRYSPACRTVWAKVLALYPSPVINGIQTYSGGVIHRNSDNVEISCPTVNFNTGDNGWECETNMLYDASVTSFAKGILMDPRIDNYKTWDTLSY